MFQVLKGWAVVTFTLLALVPCSFAQPPGLPEERPFAWGDINGDGAVETVRLRPVLRDGVHGFDFGVWNAAGRQYYGDLAQMPALPGMFGYSFSLGADLDGDGFAEL